MLEKLNDVLSEQIQTYLENSGKQADEYKTQIAEFIQQLEPDINESLARAMQGDGVAVTNLKLLSGQIASKVTSVGLDAIDDQGVAISSIVTAVLHTAIRLLL